MCVGWAGILGHSCFVESHPQAREAEEAKEKAKANLPSDSEQCRAASSLA